MTTVMRSLLALLLACACIAAQAQSRAAAGAEHRLALVIGNGSYKDAPLANPVNDATAIAKTLQGLGFKVILRTNVSQSQMRAAVREFGDELHANRGVGLFYFAGHGMQINNRNFLIPVGTDIRREYEVEDQSVDAGSVLSMMQSARARVNIVILDACRNNPFARSFRNSTVGLAPMQAPAGTLLAYATAPGEVASDGTGDNGLYTQHLLNNMRVPGLKIEDVFKNVRASVRQESAGRQTPWENTSLEGEFYFNINITINVQAAPAGAAAPGVTRADIEGAVAAALARQQQGDAARREAQQLEIERAVQAALRKREEEAAAQTANQGKDAQAAQAAVARLKQELAELQAAARARENAAAAAAATSTAPSRAKPLPAENPAAPPPAAATPPPQQVALAAPSTRPAAPFSVGQPVEKPDVAIGMRWRYEVTDLLSRSKRDAIIEVQSVTESRIYTAGVQGAAIQVWDRHWNLLRDGNTEYSSPYPALQFPLTAGQKWRNENQYEIMQGILYQQTDGRIIGWEKLKVPAGMFDVVKIEIRGHWRHAHALHPTSGTITDVLYYAPQTGNFIKREIHKSSYGAPNAPSHAVNERWELAEQP
jgi:uncharacterized caspase-like protein